jgi:hypothetical protein
MFFAVYIAEVDGVGGRGSGETASVNAQVETFLNMSLTSSCFILEVFFC